MYNKFLIFFIAVFSIIHSQEKLDKSNLLIETRKDVKLNRINLTLYERGMIGDNIAWRPENNSRFDNLTFLQSSGFFISGTNNNGEEWANGVQAKYGINDYLSGPVNKKLNSESIYVMSKEFVPFGIEWQNWINAVAQGAEFYDGDKDGIYNPVDKNGNGICDENEDRPVFYGDIMVWSIFNDGLQENQRKTNDVKPQGIEIQQFVWAYNTKPILETSYFVKYNITNKGNVSEQHNDVYFSICTDASLGYLERNLLGSDVMLNCSYLYTNDENYFSDDNQICFAANLLQGPIQSTDNLENEAYILDGEELIYKQISNSLNSKLNLVSSIRRNNFYSDKSLLREKLIFGNNPNPCEDQASIVLNEDCNVINNKYLYSGNPIRSKGWINNIPNDKIILMSTGPFNLKVNEPKEIIYSFVIGTGENGLTALMDSKNIIKEINKMYYKPPKELPKINPTIITSNSSIELIWETSEFLNYDSKGYNYDMDFEGFNVYMYNAPLISENINNSSNVIKIASYDVNNDINKIIVEDDLEGDTDVIYSEGKQLYDYIYSDEKTGRIILKISRDPFTHENLKKSKPYFIAVCPFAVNSKELRKENNHGTYILPYFSNYGYYETTPKIIKDNKGNPGIVLGENENDPYYKGIPLQHTLGNSDVVITYSVYNKDDLKDNIYEVGFLENNSQYYSLNYYIKNLTNGEYLIENDFISGFSSNIQNLKDGFVINLYNIEPGVTDVTFEGNTKWYKEFDNLETGVFYLGTDVYQKQKITPVLPLKYSSAISVYDQANIELRFGEFGKAYRYLRNTVRYLWAGNNNASLGFVDVPVTAHKILSNGETEQLSIGFLENGFVSDSLTYPDAKWNPGASIKQSKEYLIVFNSKYSDDFSEHLVYTGNSENIANISHGYTLQTENDSLKSIARSPWFNAMYVIGLEMEEYIGKFSPYGIIKIKANQVLSPFDKYVFKVKKEKDSGELKEQFSKVNVYPNPLFAYNEASGYYGNRVDEPFVTFSNLPKEVTIKIYTLSGTLIKEINKNNLSTMQQWDLHNEYGRRVGSGMYLAIIESPGIGVKTLKFAIIMPQKQIHFK